MNYICLRARKNIIIIITINLQQRKKLYALKSGIAEME